MNRVSVSLVAAVAAAMIAVPVTAGLGTTRRVAARMGSSSDQIKRRLVGTWRLTSFVLVNERGTVVGHPYGNHPEGKLTYTSDGVVWAYTSQGGAAKSERTGNWYTGIFSINPRNHTVVHHAVYSSIRSWEATRLIRRYEFAGSRRLTLATLPEGPKGNKTSLVLRWRKVSP